MGPPRIELGIAHPTTLAVAHPTTDTTSSIGAAVERWFQLDRTDKALHWEQARICAELERMRGCRTGEDTPVQEPLKATSDEPR